MLGHIQGLENLEFEDDWRVLINSSLRLRTRFGLFSHIVKLSRILGKELMGHVELRTQLCVIALETPLKASKQRGNVVDGGGGSDHHQIVVRDSGGSGLR